MINPLAPFLNWFVAFQSVVPAPAYSFLLLVLAIFFLSSIFRWFL